MMTLDRTHTSAARPRNSRRLPQQLPGAIVVVAMLAATLLVAATAPGCLREPTTSDGQIALMQAELDRLKDQIKESNENDAATAGADNSQLTELIALLREGNARDGAGDTSSNGGGAASADLSDMRAQIRTLENDHRALRDKYETLLTEVSNRRPIEEQLENIQSTLDAANATIMSLQAENADLRAVNAQNWTLLLEQLEANATSLDAEAFRQQLASIKGELEGLRIDYEAIREQNSVLEEQITEQEETIESLRDDVRSGNAEVARLTQELEDARGGMTTLPPPDDDGPAAGAIEGQVGAVSGGSAIVIFASSAEIRVGTTFNVFNHDDEKIGTFRVTSDSTPENHSDPNTKWWGGTLSLLDGEVVVVGNRVSNLR